MNVNIGLPTIKPMEQIFSVQENHAKDYSKKK